ncbi:MAG: hypothetical protein HOE90_14315 [Bacteriovoracaceae bacterium]|jgi:hypothetical protein|nr:hypothetical protein [Bacteriovoracaceae bacterium]
MIAVLLWILWSPQIAHAQVATAQMDPQTTAQSAAAISWRRLTSLSFGYTKTNGDKKPGLLDQVDYEEKGPHAIGNFHLGHMSFQLNYQSLSQDENFGKFDTETTNLAILSALRIGKILAVGADFKKESVGSQEAKVNSWQNLDDGSFDSTTNKLGGSISYKMGEMFFLGARLAMVKNEHTKRVDNFWFERDLGISLLTSGKKGVRLRSELYWHHSPRMKKKAQGSLWVNHHPETDRYGLLAGISMGSMVISALWERQKDSRPTENTYDKSTSLLKVGFSDKIFSKHIIGSFHYSKFKMYDSYFSKMANIYMLGLTFRK